MSYAFVLAFTVVAVLAGTASFTRSMPMAFMEGGYPIWMAKFKLLNDCDLGEMAFFGDSAIDAAIVPNRFPLKTTNFGFAGSSPIEISYFVNRAMACARPAKRVFLSFGPGGFSAVQPWLWENAVRYRVLNWDELLDIRRTAERVGDPSFNAALTHDGLAGPFRDVMYGTHFPSIYFNNLINARLVYRLGVNEDRFARAYDQRGYFSYGNADLGRLGGGVRFQPLPVQKEYFAKILDALAAKGVAAEFVMTPISAATFRNSDQAGLVSYAGYLSDMRATYPNLRVLSDRIPVWPDEFFVDGAHLNARGAQKFSDLMRSCAASPRAADGTCDFGI